MPYTEKDLTDEIEQLIETKQCAIEQSWLAKAIMQRHTAGIEGPEKEFFVLCGWGFVKSAIRGVIRKLKPDPLEDIDPQLVLPGYTCLQKRYCVVRDDKSWIVPIHELTDHELISKEKEYLAMADGCEAHAKELKRYRMARQKQTPA